MDSFSLSPGPLAQTYQETHDRLTRLHFTESLWSRRVEMWSTDAGVQQTIANRLGWLDALDFVTPQLNRVRAAAEKARADGFTDVVLLGMGGSSLAPEVMRQVLGVAPGFPQLHMLDSVDPEAVDRALSHVERSLFIFASKSGGTIEPNAMAAEAARRLSAAGVTPWGSRFIAITDEGTALHRRAVAEHFRDIFVNPSDIGGRYSALSFFGIVPAALMGVDVDVFVGRARRMVDACRVPDAGNPGTGLGVFMAAAAIAGRDKLTLLLPSRLASFGLWVEQLVAESTGKKPAHSSPERTDGVGIIPIAGEAAEAPFGSDRAGVVIHVGNESPNRAQLESLRAAGVPFAEIHVPDVLSLGAEFFRWEIATAAAGRLLDVNPFDEPNVKQAKDATTTLLEGVARTGALAAPRPDLVTNGAALTLSTTAKRMTTDARRLLDGVTAGDYLSVMAFLPPEDLDLAAALADLRRALGARAACATMFGYGPRYLHSTGQLHKGGANTGIFVIVTAPSSVDFQIPGFGYSFATLEQAQALGDFHSLEQTGRRALLVQLDQRSPDAIRRLTALLT